MSIHNKNSDDFFSKEQEEILKRSFESYEKNLGITKETPDYLKQSFERKLVALTPIKKSYSFNWKVLITSIFTAFSIGILISRFLVFPAAVATRGIGNNEVVHQLISAQEYVSILVANPKEFTFEIIASALESDMDVEVTQSGGKYSLYLKPFKPNSKSQEQIKILLGIKPEMAGSVNVIIGLVKK